MAGGQFTDYNKKLPGLYIRYKTVGGLTATVGERGTVAIAKKLDWGTPGQFMEINNIDKIAEVTGHSLTEDEMLFVREMIRGTDLTSGASKILLWRLEEQNSAKASVKIGNLTVTAKDPGSTGNKLKIIVAPVPESKNTDNANEDEFYQWKVDTVLNNKIVATETVGTWNGSKDGAEALGTIANLKGNDYVSFSGTGSFEANVGVSLTGGQDSGITPTAHTNFLTALGKKQFNTVIYDGTDKVLQSTYVAFVKRLCQDEGRYCVLVTSDYTNANSEYVISVNNGVKLETGEELTPAQMTWWVGGASAGANYNESLTYHQHPAAVDVVTEYDNTELGDLKEKGNFLFFKHDGKVLVVSDVNTHTSLTEDKGKALQKNRVVRTIMQICNDLYTGYVNSYIGKVNVNPNGIKLVKGYAVNYLNQIQNNEGIKNFDGKEDVTVKEYEIDSMIMGLYIQPVDSLEKLYIEMSIA